MKVPNFTDKHRGRYYTAQESREPGYLARRFEEIRAKLREQEERRANTIAIRKLSSNR